MKEVFKCRERRVMSDACGVDSFSPSSWKPQEEGMINIAAKFSLSKKLRFIDQERSRQMTESDAC
jgi:hypothetical protein